MCSLVNVDDFLRFASFPSGMYDELMIVVGLNKCITGKEKKWDIFLAVSAVEMFAKGAAKVYFFFLERNSISSN